MSSLAACARPNHLPNSLFSQHTELTAERVKRGEGDGSGRVTSTFWARLLLDDHWAFEDTKQRDAFLKLSLDLSLSPSLSHFSLLFKPRHHLVEIA